MKRFSFRLQSVLNYRGQVEKDLEDRLALKNKELLEQRAKVDTLKQYNDWICDELENNLQVGCDANTARIYSDYIKKLGIDIKDQQRCLAEIQYEADNIRAQLIKAAQDEKILSTLRGKYWKTYVHEFYHEEEKAIDNVLSHKYFKEKENA